MLPRWRPGRRLLRHCHRPKFISTVVTCALPSSLTFARLVNFFSVLFVLAAFLGNQRMRFGGTVSRSFSTCFAALASFFAGSFFFFLSFAILNLTMYDEVDCQGVGVST